MMRRLITLLTATFFVCTAMLANEEYNMTLEKGDTEGYTTELPYGNISFKLVDYNNYNRVLVTIENTTPSMAFLIFKHSEGEKTLKKNKPKIEFEKTYPGSKGERSVYGCKELNRPIVSIIPQEKQVLFTLDVSATSDTKLELPIYLAKYDPKKLIKKGPGNITYKILSQDILNFNITIKTWSEDDPEYVSTKSAVEKYVQSVETAEFCTNKRHVPSLTQQKLPYQERKDSLVNVIKTIIGNHSEWFSTDKPHVKYSELLTLLNTVDLNEHTRDCGKHNTTPPPPRCGYCSLSSQQIYHQLDDIYQQLRTGKLKKDAALKKAQALNACYQKHKKSRKDPNYTEKISRFYSRIVSY